MHGQCNVMLTLRRSKATLFPWNGRLDRARMREFPEIDRAEWFKIGVAKRKILKSQLGLLEQLEEAMASAQENVSGFTLYSAASLIQEKCKSRSAPQIIVKMLGLGGIPQIADHLLLNLPDAFSR